LKDTIYDTKQPNKNEQKVTLSPSKKKGKSEIRYLYFLTIHKEDTQMIP